MQKNKLKNLINNFNKYPSYNMFVSMSWCNKIDTSNIVLIKKILLYKIFFFLFKYYQYVLGKI
jgi:hypothetical protein